MSQDELKLLMCDKKKRERQSERRTRNVLYNGSFYERSWEQNGDKTSHTGIKFYQIEKKSLFVGHTMNRQRKEKKTVEICKEFFVP